MDDYKRTLEMLGDEDDIDESHLMDTMRILERENIVLEARLEMFRECSNQAISLCNEMVKYMPYEIRTDYISRVSRLILKGIENG